MLDGVYKNRTEVYFGPSSINALGPRIIQEGSRVLLIYGGDSVHSCGAYGDVISALKNSKVLYIELGGVRPNPVADKVKEGILLCKNYNIDLVLAVGGGSVIDTAKVIALGAKDLTSVNVFDWFDGAALPEAALPVGVVLTIPGSGSESSGDAVISFPELHEKRPISTPLISPRFAFLNPNYTLRLPLELTFSGIWDAISHVLERYFTNEQSVDCTSRLSEALILSLMTTATKLLRNPDSYDYRAEAMWGCKLAHDGTIAFGRKADWAVHRITHELEAIYNTRHGSTLAVIYPAWMEFCREYQPALFEQLQARLVDFSRCSDVNLVDIFRRFINTCGLPITLISLGISDYSQLSRVAQNSIKRQKSCTIGHFVRLGENDIQKILALAR